MLQTLLGQKKYEEEMSEKQSLSKRGLAKESHLKKGGVVMITISSHKKMAIIYCTRHVKLQQDI